MKFEPDTLNGVNVLSRHEPGRVWVNGTAWTRSVVVPSRGAVTAWEPETFSGLKAEHFDALAAHGPAVVIFGSGQRLRFAPPALLRGLMERRIGVEAMDVAAACRTYNVLAAEGRAVVAALLLEAGPA